MSRGCKLAILAASLTSAAFALDPHRAIGQYVHTQWTAGREFPGGAVNAIAEADGYLWIGAEKGLVRFDGLTFRAFNPSTAVLGLTSGFEGELWIRIERPGVVRYRGGAFQDVFPNATPDNGVTAMGRGLHGDILLARPGDPVRYHAGKFESMTPFVPDAARLVIAVAEAADGAVWMGTRDAGVFFLRGGRAIVPAGAHDRKVNCLLPGVGPEMWVGTDAGLVRWDGSELTRNGVPAALRNAQVLALARDREANLWVGTASGLMRINRYGVATAARREPVSALFEDREGNLWVGSAHGIERYRDSAFLTYDHLTYDHLTYDQPNESGGPVYAGDSGRTWFGPPDGGLRWLDTVGSGRFTADGLDRDVVYSIDGGPGELWIGRQRGGLTHLLTAHGVLTSETVTAASGLAHGSVYAVHRARDGSVWAGTLGGGVSHLRNGRITTYTTADGIASNTISAIGETPDGAMWFATPDGINGFAQGHWRLYTSQDGLPPGRVNCLTADSAGTLWIGTGAGLAYLRGGRVQTPGEPLAALLDEVFGIAPDRHGGLWISTASHVVRMSDAGGIREFDPTDGLPAGGGVRRNRSVVADPSGRIWFSLQGGIAVVDPARTVDTVPAIVHIQTVSADGNPVESAPPLRIPSARQRINFRFNGVSLAVPERVRFRYRLDGFDRDWSEASDVREAVYTNLAPGPYRFRVIAANSQGLWNGSEAAIAFELTPAYWQTWWFRLSLAGASLLALLAAYRFRLHHLTRQLNLRFEERLAERTRIAQDLHDTLLQGMLSASMQLHVAADTLPEELPARPQLNRVLQLMQRVVEEGRHAVYGLRSVHDLEGAFSGLRDEGFVPPTTDFRIVVEGRRRAINPPIRDEAYRIAREALINAFRHSGAARVELVLEFSPAAFRVRVRDNGRGIDPLLLESGRDGHWGLTGMRERADRIKGHLKFSTRATAGTEIELTIPAPIAFQSPD
ncbi:MAG: putative two-component system sensor kinase [Candidatus Solibacter sp.]|nr:putative two-component system sensor kinase [Candidatus Solibacter sp.]